MTNAAFEERFPLSNDQQRFVLLLIARGVKLPDIHRRLTSPDATLRDGLPVYTGDYDAFRMRVKRLRKGVTTTDPQQQEQKAAQRKLDEIDLDTPTGKLDFLRALIKDATLSADAKLKAFDRLVEMQGATEGNLNRTLLTDPNNIEITVESMTELFFCLIGDIGGIEKLDFSALCDADLKAFIAHLQAIQQKREADREKEARGCETALPQAGHAIPEPPVADADEDAGPSAPGAVDAKQPTEEDIARDKAEKDAANKAAKDAADRRASAGDWKRKPLPTRWSDLF